MTRTALVSALEAHDAGDQAYAVEVMLSALEDGTAARRFACPKCPNTYEWPGLLAKHRLLIHGFEGDE